MILERCHWHYFGTKNPTEYTESAEYKESDFAARASMRGQSVLVGVPTDVLSAE